MIIADEKTCLALNFVPKPVEETPSLKELNKVNITVIVSDTFRSYHLGCCGNNGCDLQ